MFKQRPTPRFRMEMIAILLILPATAGRVSAAKQPTYADLVARLTHLERLATPVVAGEKTFASTSHDRGMSYDPSTDSYRNWSANRDGSGCIRRVGDAQVMVDLEGPGVLWRTWSAKAGVGHIKIFLDGNETPVINKPFQAYFDDLEKEFPGLAMTLSRGRNEFVPISFAESCKVVVEKGWGMYFHCTHTLFPEGTKVETFPGFTPEVVAQLKKASDAWNECGSNPYSNDSGTVTEKKALTIEPRQTESLSLAGAGAVRALKVKPLELPEDKIAQEDLLRELTISMFWDGDTSPSVWAPLGDFFATSPGINPFETLVMGCIEGKFYSYWYMPYADGAQIVFTNDGKETRKLELELETVELEKSAAARLLRFNAAWHSDDFTGLDAKRFLRKGGDRWPDWPLLVVEGKGRYVGMTEHIWKFGGWWGEGDEKFFIDGEKYPSTVGTGSEDYIGYAWAANPPFVTFDSALAAVSRLRPDAQEDTSVCRFHVCDDLPFSNCFQGFIEVMPNGNCRPCVYDTCVFWYAEQDAKNPYPIVALDGRRQLRPSREQRDAVPSTMQMPKLHPDAIEGEHLKVLSIGSGRHWVQNMSSYRDGQWSGDTQLIWTKGKQDEAIEIEFPAPKTGQYELMAVFTKAGDYGIFEMAVDGKTIGKPIDLYDPKVTTTGEVSLGTVQLHTGTHVLKATAIGHNEKSKDTHAGNHIFGLDYLRLK
ncbi:MAG: DUF2961 domain-containing protein [Planctomycetes bacterium]|nr:DUF2961 domain-containing protein [Planctomycetota bacterium]MBL7037104.1 DUF2961 domain-containing protein [Pirellulaceae bacterium]